MYMKTREEDLLCEDADEVMAFLKDAMNRDWPDGPAERAGLLDQCAAVFQRKEHGGRTGLVSMIVGRRFTMVHFKGEHLYTVGNESGVHGVDMGSPDFPMTLGDAMALGRT